MSKHIIEFWDDAGLMVEEEVEVFSSPEEARRLAEILNKRCKGTLTAKIREVLS